jgi:hypothetical protein
MKLLISPEIEAVSSDSLSPFAGANGLPYTAGAVHPSRISRSIRDSESGRPNRAVRVVDQRTLAGGIAHISMSEDIRTWMRTSELSDMEAHCVTPCKAAVGVILSIPGYDE